jgi:predicted nuclease of predicted toxin-antitoxin system
MKIWLDAQLSPALVRWIEETFGLDAYAVQADPEMISAKDTEIFHAARAAGAVVMTKDRDFVDLLERFGPPPQVIWITCGNTSNRAMMHILSSSLPAAVDLIRSGEPLVEISDVR